MKLIRYILSHGILLLLIAALVVAYYYRTQLFSADINSQVDRVVGKALSWTEIFKSKEATAHSSEEVISSAPVEEVQEQSAIETAAVEQSAVMTEMPIRETPESDTATAQPSPAPDEQTADVAAMPVPEDVTQEEVVTTDVAMAEANATVAEENVTPENDQAAAVETMPVPEVATQEEVVTTDVAMAEANAAPQEDFTPENDQAAAADSHTSLLNRARLAFQNGNPDQAITLYKELRELNPDDPNVHGEMGNIFYSQGKWKEAGVAYYEAADRLLAQGQTSQVQYLYRVIQGLDEESAEKLRSRLGK